MQAQPERSTHALRPPTPVFRLPTSASRYPRPDLGSLVPLSHVEPERVTWLSPGRLAAGKLTILDGETPPSGGGGLGGEPGLGKSTLLCDVAARVTRGHALPGGQPSQPRGVILMSAEDDLFDTIRPRIDAAGGDPTRVFSLASLSEEFGGGRLFAVPSHLPLLENVITRLDIALLIIDPLVAFLERRLSAHNDQHMRRAFIALKDLAESTGVAIVAVRHLNKASGGNPLYRGGGSIGIIAAARCGLLLAADLDDPTRRILATSKANLILPPPSLAFRLAPVPGSDVARIAWEGESPYTADDLLRGATNREMATALNAVRAWLRDRLADGPQPAAELLAQAEAAGLSLASVRRARQVERIIVRKSRGRHGGWIWSLPDHENKDALPSCHSSRRQEPLPLTAVGEGVGGEGLSRGAVMKELSHFRPPSSVLRPA